MYNVIYHIETGLVILSGSLENDKFSTITLDKEFQNGQCILVNHDTKEVYDLTAKEPHLTIANINSKIESLKSQLLDTDILVLDSLTNETIKNKRALLREQINELEKERENEIYKSIIVDQKYRILKYIEGLERDISSISVLIDRIFGRVVDETA